MKLRALPIAIEAVQFNGAGFIVPQWLRHAIEGGSASVTNGHGDAYVTIYGRNSRKRAYVGDWICVNESDSIFVLSDGEIFKTFERVE